MFSRIRARLTYANVVSSIALFVALGGTAYAVNTIGSDDVIDESLQSQDIKNGQVKNADIGADSVTTFKIKNGNVTNLDLGADAVTGAKVDESTLDLGSFFAASSASGGICNADAHTPTVCG